VRHALANCTFFPKPAELRAAITDELADHRRRVEEAWRASLPKLPPPPPPTPEDIAYVADLLAPMRAATAAKTAVIKRGE